MKSRRKNFKACAFKPKSSIRLCQEKYACKESKTVSVYYCRDCDTYQCDACEVLLHEDERLIFHVRERVVPASEEILCDGNCPDKNYADVICQSCSSKFCYQCDRIVHLQKSKKTHPRGRFLHESEEFISCEPYIPSSESSSEEEEMLSLEDCLSFDKPDVLPESTFPKPLASSFTLLNEKEQLQLKSEDEFIQKLGCEDDMPFKVVSIFGNTGDGKSYTLNHTFFHGEEIFQTSALQTSCTVGVWAALCPALGIITIDTEGFLGQSNNPNTRARMLLKILAISDIVVYRTRAERLHDDMFTFLGDASDAYARHFSQELKDASSRGNIDSPVSSLGPAVVIFHETKHTEPYSKDASQTLRNQFQKLGFNLDAFSSLEYIGIKSLDKSTDFGPFKKVVEKQVQNLAVRSARSPRVVFRMLKILNEKFSVDLDKNIQKTFPDQYFTCPMRCLSCSGQCLNSMNHSKDNIPHSTSTQCIYQHKFDNKRLLCKKCFEGGLSHVVEAKSSESNDSYVSGLVKYAWQGYVLECPRCGIIYCSRQYWYGNKEPDGTCTQSKICHVWPDNPAEFNMSSNTGQVIIDSINSVAETVSAVGKKPTQYVSNWVADKIAPSYWKSNNSITHCGNCEAELDVKHHCRSCGGGFCGSCSSSKLLVDGWGNSIVRVCNKCFEIHKSKGKADAPSESENFSREVTTRKLGEFVQSTLATAISYPTALIKDTARPSYWIPDSELSECQVCKEPFSEKLSIHHCRCCGGGVCDGCSLHRKPVPLRGWKYDVRVCNHCAKDL